MEPVRAIPGLLRVARSRRIASLEFDTTLAISSTGGEVLVRPRGDPTLLLLDGELRETRRIQLRLLSTAKAVVLCEARDRLAVAGPDRLAMCDAQGGVRWTLSYPRPLTPPKPWVTGHFSANGALFWLLLPTGAYRKRGDLLLVVDADSGQVLEEREIRFALDEGPSWSLHGPHPTESTIFLEGGIGQEGSVSVLASFRGGRLHLGAGKRSVTFADYGKAGTSYVTLSQQGNRLDWDDYPCRTTRSSRDLGEVFEALDDSHVFQALHLGGERWLVPTGNGRLLVVDPQVAEVAELELEGDTRDRGWSSVAVVGGALVASRSPGRALSAWELSLD